MKLIVGRVTYRSLKSLPINNPIDTNEYRTDTEDCAHVVHVVRASTVVVSTTEDRICESQKSLT